MALRSHVEKRTLYREKGGAAAPTAEALGSVQPAASYAAPQVVLLLKIPRKKIVKGNGSKILASKYPTNVFSRNVDLSKDRRALHRDRTFAPSFGFTNETSAKKLRINICHTQAYLSYQTVRVTQTDLALVRVRLNFDEMEQVELL